MSKVDDVATKRVVARMGCRVAKFCVTGTQSGLSEICLSLPLPLKVILAGGLAALVKIYRAKTGLAMPPISESVRSMWIWRAMAGFRRLSWFLSVIVGVSLR